MTRSKLEETIMVLILSTAITVKFFVAGTVHSEKTGKFEISK